MVLVKLFWEFFKAGFFAFGGGYALIPLIQKDIVERYRWLTADEFTETVAMAGMAPGVFAANSAAYIGYKVAHVWGALVSILGVALPSLFVILAIAVFFPQFKDNPMVRSALEGLRPAVVGLIIVAALTIGAAHMSFKSALIVLLVVCGVFFLKLHPVVALLASAIAGILFFR